jgi:hypothetical protein
MGSFARCFCLLGVSVGGDVPSEESPPVRSLSVVRRLPTYTSYQLGDHVLTEEVSHSDPRATNDNDKVMAVRCSQGEDHRP